jgi:DNA helicase-2/ATP-dependent DNA helicase PcrA
MPKFLDEEIKQDLSYLKGLNEAQLEAVQKIDGPLLILAGAGTGKTKVLTCRIAHIINSTYTHPSEILAVTFTNKAAREMTERVSQLASTDGIWLGTFHSIAAKILRRHAELIGFATNYTIIDTDDQLRLIKSIAISLNIDPKKYPPKYILSAIQRWKDIALLPQQVSSREASSHTQIVALKIYHEYQIRLSNLGSMDFGDLLLYNIKLFTEHPDLLLQYQHRFRYVLVDEYQDTNIAQYIWLRMLAQHYKNICCVGDEDQSIYSWRGAEIGNILRFERDFPEAKIIRLERNYRSTSTILAIACKLIANNKKRLGKTLWTDKEGENAKIIRVWDEREEARYVASEIMLLRRSKNISYNNIAILVRAGFQTRAFEECFVSHGLPYRVIGGLRFYERLEIRDIIAYIRVCANYEDDLALERIINTPKRSIGESTIKSIYSYGQAHSLSLFNSIQEMLAKGELKQRNKATLESLIAYFKRWRELFNEKKHSEVVDIILKESGYLAMWQQEKTIEAEGRIENIKELVRSLDDFNNITEFLEYVSLVSSIDEQRNDDMMSIMTLHAAKGLEFDFVFLPAWEEGIFPHQKSLEENGDMALEEERRLAYVGITRAKLGLYILFASYRRIYNQQQHSIASRFISELPLEFIDKIGLPS